MPLLGFTMFKEKILDGSKRQTIRLARKQQIKVGDKLYLFWKLRTKECEKLGETICTESYQVPWGVIRSDVAVARLDGFDDLFQYRKWFVSHYHPQGDTLFDVIRWSYPFRSETKIPMQIISWNEMPSANKFLLLKVFDFDMDKEGFIIKNGERIRDKYTGKYVRFDTVALFPDKLGKPIVFNDNPLSISSYLEEYEIVEESETN